MSAPDRTPPPYVALPPESDLPTMAAREAASGGWRLHNGFELPDEPWDVGSRRVLVVGRVDDESAAQAALLCAVRGAGLVVTLDHGAAWAAAFLADLARLRPNDALPGGSGNRDDVPLSDEQRALLDLLAEGHSIAQAARRLYLSLRTANRRVAEARSALGVATTREAVLAYARLRERES